MTAIDHIIVAVNDLAASVDFWTNVIGFHDDGMDGPFTRIRVSDDFILQLVPSGTRGFEHYAFWLPPDEFAAAFDRIKARGIEYGDAFNTVGSNQGPGSENGARGFGPTVYVFDPNKHLIEIRTT